MRYDNRPLFYRIALSDMNIPYADPRHPFHKKAAFDLGDAGAGHTANDLQLGCDCLGSIYYISAVLSNSVGDIMEKNNCICIHEQVSHVLTTTEQESSRNLTLSATGQWYWVEAHQLSHRQGGSYPWPRTCYPVDPNCGQLRIYSCIHPQPSRRAYV